MSLARRALSAAWLDGNSDKAFTLAKSVNKTLPDEAFSRTLLGTKAFADGNYNQAKRILNYDTPDVTLDILKNLMLAWTENELGDSKAGQDRLESLSSWAYVKVLGQLQRALSLIHI